MDLGHFADTLKRLLGISDPKEQYFPLEPDAIDQASLAAKKGKRPSPYDISGLSQLRRAIDPKEHAAAQMYGRMSPFHRNQSQLLDEFYSEEKARNYQRNMMPIVKGTPAKDDPSMVEYSPQEVEILKALANGHAKAVGQPPVDSVPPEHRANYFWALTQDRRAMLKNANAVDQNRKKALQGPHPAPPQIADDATGLVYYDLSKKISTDKKR